MIHALCPKCGHAPLPENQAAPAACPSCGVILAKVGVFVRRRRAGMTVSPSEAPGRVADAGTVFLHLPDTVARSVWGARLATLAVYCLWTAWIWRGIDVRAGEAGSFVLWAVLTPFHEAGHVLLFWAPAFMAILGGTLGQHLMPLVLAGALLIRRRDPFGAALFAWLFGYSLIMMAVYMYDAFDPRIMLLDGRTGADSDGHDWQNMFGDLGLLRNARGIGLFFAWAGRLVMLASLGWAGCIVWMQRARLPDSALAETRSNVDTP